MSAPEGDSPGESPLAEQLRYFRIEGLIFGAGPWVFAAPPGRFMDMNPVTKLGQEGAKA